MAVSWQALGSAIREMCRAQEQLHLLDAQESAQRMTGLHLPYDPAHPPCHIRVKQVIVLGGCFIGGIAFLILGKSLLERAGKSDLEFLSGVGITLFGIFIACISLQCALIACCSPVYRSEADGTYRASWPCLPCISAPCNTCHCTETTIEV